MVTMSDICLLITRAGCRRRRSTVVATTEIKSDHLDRVLFLPTIEVFVRAVGKGTARPARVPAGQAPGMLNTFSVRHSISRHVPHVISAISHVPSVTGHDYFPGYIIKSSYMERPTLLTSPVERCLAESNLRVTLLKLWPEHQYGRTCQPRPGDGVLLEKCWWGRVG
jgi:hypothetical protein